MIHLGEQPNVVNLVGACTKNGTLNVLIEYCSNGSLLSYLRSIRDKDLFVPSWDKDAIEEASLRDLLQIILQAASGMRFLEEKSVSVNSGLPIRSPAGSRCFLVDDCIQVVSKMNVQSLGCLLTVRLLFFYIVFIK